MSGPAAGPRGEVAVGLGEAAVGGPGVELVAYGLGSCVGLALWSPARRLGVLCHIVLPDSGGAPPDPAAPARFADRAVPWAVSALVAQGARPDGLVARLAGGARILPIRLATDIGQRNVEATLAALTRAGIPVRGADTGGSQGRTLRFDPGTGDVWVRPVGGAPVRL